MGPLLFRPEGQALIRLLVVFTILAISLACGGGSAGGGAGLANGDGISGTGSIQLSKVGLASESYGSGNHLSFELNTLAPILVVEFAQVQESDPNKNFRITLADLQQNQSLTILGGEGSPSNLFFKPGSDGRTYYIHLSKSKNLTTAQTELKPGGHYRFSIESLSGQSFLFNGESVSKLSGTLSVKDLTLTFLGDFRNGESLVRLDDQLKGIGSLTPEFLIHTNLPLPDSDLGRSLGPLSLIDIRFGNTSLLKAGTDYVEILEVHRHAVLIRVKNAPFYWGGQYKLDVLPKSTDETGFALPLSSKNIPTVLQLQLQNSPN
jgi:hypothetical protein